MGPLATTLLLESLALPWLIATLVMSLARSFERAAMIAPVLAIFLAVTTTYVLAFGWPTRPVIDAKAKIMLAAPLGLAAGFLIERQAPSARIAAWALTAGLPLWVGFPLLQQLELDSAFPVLPIVAGALIVWFFFRTTGDERTAQGSAQQLLVLTTLAFGLAAIAALGKALSFAELGLAIGACLLAISMTTRESFGVTAATMAVSMLLALFTALLSFSDASPLALAILAIVIGAVPLARLSGGGQEQAPSFPRVLACCLFPMITAILIARIDAGAISIY